jgi:hypothetical protein
LQVSVIISLLINGVFLFIFITQLERLCSRLIAPDKNKDLLLILILTTMPVIYPFISGLETGLTTMLLMVQINLFLQEKWKKFTIVSVVLSINRPENIILNMAYVLIIFLRKKNINFSYKRMAVYSIIILISIFTVPLLNYFITGDFRTSSAARVDFHGIQFIRAIFNALSSPYSEPVFINSAWYVWFDIVRIFFIAFIAFLLFKKLSRKAGIVRGLNLYSVHKLARKEYVPLVIFVSMLSYALIPLLFSVKFAEWGRYLSPVIPFYYLLLMYFFSFSKKSIYLLIALNTITFVFYTIGHINSTTLMGKTIRPVAEKINLITDEHSVVALDTAGYLSLFANGKVIDVYGLGTTRYMKVHGDFNKVYNLIRVDNIDYFIAWVTDQPTHYLDSSHYENVFGKNNITKVFEYDVYFPLYSDDSFPEKIGIYRVNKVY